MYKETEITFALIENKFLLDRWWTSSKWMGEHCKKIHLQPGCCCTCTLATPYPPPHKKTRRICINLSNGLWQ